MARRSNKDEEVIGVAPLEIDEDEEKEEDEEGVVLDPEKIIEPEGIIADAPEGTLINDDEEEKDKEDDDDDEESYNPMEDYEEGILG